MLTVILIPTGSKYHQETIDSFKGIPTKVCSLTYEERFNIFVSTKWKIFMYSGEFLSNDLNLALPEFLEKGDAFDAFEIYKSTPRGYSISPRLFKGNVKVHDTSLMPVEKDLKITAILDGFILER
jgi:hypothetical protein